MADTCCGALYVSGWACASGTGHAYVMLGCVLFFSAVSHPVVVMVSPLHNSALGKCALTLGILAIHSCGLSSRKTSRYIVRWKGFESSERSGWAVNGAGICPYTDFC